jgi:hypothetical protein
MATEEPEVKDERLDTHEEGGDDEVRFIEKLFYATFGIEETRSLFLLLRAPFAPSLRDIICTAASLFLLDQANRMPHHLGGDRGHEATGRRDGVRSRKVTGDASYP